MSESPSLPVLPESIAEAYTLLPPEIDFLGSKKVVNRFGQALMLKYFQEYGRFPEQLEAIPPEAIGWIAEQLLVPPVLIHQFDWQGRSCMRYRAAIREWLGYRPNTLNEQARLRKWLMEEILPDEHRPLHLEKIAYQYGVALTKSHTWQ